MICIYKIIELYLWYRFFKRSHRTSCIWAQLSWNVPSISTEFYLYLLNEVELSPKIRIKYRNHWKGYVSFQLSGQNGQFGLIWAILKLLYKLTAISPAKDNFSYQFSTRYPNQKKLGSPLLKPKKHLGSSQWLQKLMDLNHKTYLLSQ